MTSSHTNGVSVDYTYDDLNRLSTIVDNRLGSGANTTTYTYDPANNLATVTYPNGLQSTLSYDQLNRLASLTSSVSGYDYQYGPTGNRTSSVEANGRALNWSYDGIYRLTNETVTSAPSGKNGSVSYGLDPVGNRLSDTSSLSGVSSSSATFDADDRLSTETYDGNGNTLTTGGKTFTYDSENHLMSMNAGAVTLVYDGDGNRVAKTVDGVTTRYLVDDLNPTGYAQVVEETVSGTVERQYTYGLQRISENQVLSSTWTPSFYGYDGAGTVRQLTSISGAVTDTYEYDAWGNKINSTGTTPNNYLYRAEQYDSDLGLYYLRARCYNPATGRFMSRDSEDGSAANPKTLHKYLYADGDPVNRIDPKGKDAFLNYLTEEGESEETVTSYAKSLNTFREELYNFCLEENLPIFESQGIETLAAYNLVKSLCAFWLVL
jgi:RHS repeat-associated protein